MLWAPLPYMLVVLKERIYEWILTDEIILLLFQYGEEVQKWKTAYLSIGNIVALSFPGRIRDISIFQRIKKPRSDFGTVM